MLSRLWVVGLVVVMLSVPMVASAGREFEADITITGDPPVLEIEVGDSATLTAEWATNEKNVTRYEWSVDSVGQGFVEIDAWQGTQEFVFEGEQAGTFNVCFRIWHHEKYKPEKGGWDATECVPVTVTEAECEWVGETAWADGARYVEQGNWATYTLYVAGSTVDLLAGQDMEAGTVHFSEAADDWVTITIALSTGWRFKDVAENVKIQDYADAPSGNPSPGLFAHKGYATGSPFSIEVSANNLYGVHVDVEWENCS